MNNRFARGYGRTVFNCACCDRSTRMTGEGDGTGFCAQCYEIFGLDNTINDGCSKKQATSCNRSANMLLGKIKDKGGDINKVKGNCTHITWN